MPEGLISTSGAASDYLVENAVPSAVPPSIRSKNVSDVDDDGVDVGIGENRTSQSPVIVVSVNRRPRDLLSLKDVGGVTLGDHVPWIVAVIERHSRQSSIRHGSHGAMVGSRVDTDEQPAWPDGYP